MPLIQDAAISQIASARSQQAVDISFSSSEKHSNNGVSLSTSQAQFVQEDMDHTDVSQDQLPSKSVDCLTSQQTHNSSVISVASLPTDNKSVASLPIRRVKKRSLQSMSSFFRNNKKGLLLSDLNKEMLPQMTTSSRKIFERFGTDPRTETAIPEAHQQHAGSGGQQISCDDTIDKSPDEYHYYLNDGDEQVVRSRPFISVIDKESGDMTSLTTQPLMSGGLDGGRALIKGEAIGQREAAMRDGGTHVVVEDKPVVEEKTVQDDAQDDAPNEAFADDEDNEDIISKSYFTNQKPPSLL